MQIYADNAATTKISDEALRVLIDIYKEHFANPSSSHFLGNDAKTILERSRISIKRDLNTQLDDNVIFTSGGSESDNLALQIFKAQGNRTGKKHIISTKIEHHAILNKLESLRKEGFDIELLDVPSDGIVKSSDLINAIREDTVGVSIMFANNETGTIQHIDNLSKICNEKGILFHTDAVQAAGHIPINFKDLNVDLLSISGHKFHGPKGIGALIARKGINLIPLIYGGSQENGVRGGTHALPEIAAMATALHESVSNLKTSQRNLKEQSEKIISSILEIEDAYLNGDRFLRLPGTINFTFKGIDQQSIKYLLENDGIAISSGSACDSSNKGQSHVIKTLHPEYDDNDATIRISIDEAINDEQVEYLIDSIKRNIFALRNTKPVIYRKTYLRS